MPILMQAGPEGALRNQDVHIRIWNLCFHDISILLAAEIASIEHLNSINFNDEHCCPHDMTCHIGRNFDAFLFDLHSELDLTDAGKGFRDVLLREQGLLLVSHLKRVLHQIVVDVLGGLGHVHFLLVIVLC